MFQEDTNWGVEKKQWSMQVLPMNGHKNLPSKESRKKRKKRKERLTKDSGPTSSAGLNISSLAKQGVLTNQKITLPEESHNSPVCPPARPKETVSADQASGTKTKKRKKKSAIQTEKYGESKKVKINLIPEHDMSSSSSDNDSGCKSRKTTKSDLNRIKYEDTENNVSADWCEVGLGLKSGPIPFLLKRDESKARSSGKPHSSNLKAMRERLEAGRFRYINEQLYTSHSEEAAKLFAEDTAAFKIYHLGYQNQIAKWPQDPLTWIRRRIPRKAVVADFGCGDARLSSVIANKTHSFDLVAVNDRVTVCDMANVPLSDGAVDVAVFCLSLMGTNITDFIREARRVLKAGGKLLIAEVTSRFDNVNRFIKQVSGLGFSLQKMDDANKMFLEFEFNKCKVPKKKETIEISLQPCIYKKR